MKNIKQIIVLSVITILFLASCNNEPTEFHVKDLTKESIILNDMVYSTSINTFSKIDNFVHGKSFDLKGASNNSLVFMNENYLDNSIQDYSRLTNHYETIAFNQNSTPKRVANTEYLFPEHYNDVQKQIISSFFDELISTEELGKVTELANNYRQTVSSSALSVNQSVEVLAYIESAAALSVLFQEPSFLSSITNLQNDNGRVMCCSVDWKSVWQSAVLTGAGGAISGAYYGAAGGTIIVPGAGTVTGGVTGGVVGGAGGFISGASYEILRQLIFE